MHESIWGAYFFCLLSESESPESFISIVEDNEEFLNDWDSFLSDKAALSMEAKLRFLETYAEKHDMLDELKVFKELTSVPNAKAPTYINGLIFGF